MLVPKLRSIEVKGFGERWTRSTRYKHCEYKVGQFEVDDRLLKSQHCDSKYDTEVKTDKR